MDISLLFGISNAKEQEMNKPKRKNRTPQQFKETLIKEVKKYPILWDKSLRIKNRDIVAHEWQKVADKLNIPLQFCKTQWGLIYRAYKKHVNSSNKPTEGKFNVLFDRLSFLDESCQYMNIQINKQSKNSPHSAPVKKNTKRDSLHENNKKRIIFEDQVIDSDGEYISSESNSVEDINDCNDSDDGNKGKKSMENDIVTCKEIVKIILKEAVMANKGLKSIKNSLIDLYLKQKPGYRERANAFIRENRIFLETSDIEDLRYHTDPKFPACIHTAVWTYLMSQEKRSRISMKHRLSFEN